jgi:hypothetical protein
MIAILTKSPTHHVAQFVGKRAQELNPAIVKVVAPTLALIKEEIAGVSMRNLTILCTDSKADVPLA